MSDALDTDAILRMHRALLEHDDPAIAGRWREQPVHQSANSAQSCR